MFEEQLIRSISIDNCIEYFILADKVNANHLEEKVIEFIVENGYSILNEILTTLKDFLLKFFKKCEEPKMLINKNFGRNLGEHHHDQHHLSYET